MRALDPITRSDFQRLSELHLREAAALRASGHHEGVYYLAGYAVECALKARICSLRLQDQFLPRVDVVRDLYSHDLGRLLALARLESILVADPAVMLKRYWDAIREWTEGSRYAFPSQTEAEEVYLAADPTHGVLQWLHHHW